MCDRSLLFELLLELEEAIRRIERRFTRIQKADDFIADDDDADGRRHALQRCVHSCASFRIVMGSSLRLLKASNKK